MPERFLIYNASAGAGKTFQLVRNFLKLCLSGKDPMRFVHILAITFTNKAAREMKQRLLQQLELLKQYPQENEGDRKYTLELAAELEIQAEDLKFRAEAVLKAILHNYAAFNVSTIDSFTNRLIRSFSRDLDLNGNFQVEVENERFLEEAVDRLLDSLEEGNPFKDILSRYLEVQLEEEQKGSSRELLMDRGMELFKEEAFPFLSRLSELQWVELSEAEEKLQGRIKAYRQEFQAALNDFMEAAERDNLEAQHFFRGGLASWIFSYAKTAKASEFSATLKKHLAELDPDKMASAKGKKDTVLASASVRQQYLQRAYRVLRLFSEHLEEINISELLLNSIHAMALLGELELNIEAIKTETGRLPIGDFNKIISNELKEQPAPFLYERLGDRFWDFFIDEFQDTSRLQWENLLPLINNALAGEGSSAMLVGDAKQSIYRFRGGDLQLFVDLFTGRDQSNRYGGQELYPRGVVQMEQNWRSREELVNFNNAFFLQFSQKLPNADYRSIYEQGAQKAQRQPGGLIKLDLLESSEQNEALLGHMRDIFQRGYRQRDICLLSRGKDKGREAVRFLLEHEAELALPEGEFLQILSSDSLVVGSSREVRALVSFLQMNEEPKNREIRKDWIALFYQNFGEGKADEHDFKSQFAQAELSEVWTLMNQWLPDWDFADWQAEDLLEKVYQMLRAFKLDWQKDPYLQFFVDQLSDFLAANRPVVREFIEWWQDKGKERSVGIPESTNAIQVMSIHKSKGLEFPVVICLGAAGAIDKFGGYEKKAKVWVNLEKEKYHLDFGFIDLKKPLMAEYQPLYQSWYEEEISKVMMDNLNIYYVAFTRAERELIILSKLPPKNSRQVLIESELANFFEATDPGVYTIGEALSPGENEKANELYALKEFEPVPWQQRLSVVSNVPKHWQKENMQEARLGTQIHALLARLEYPKDLNKVLQEASEAAWISGTEEDQLKQGIEDLIHSPALEPLFSDQAKVYNERSILLPGSGQKIPDRLVEYQGDWYLADYKTGAHDPRHFQQLEKYISELELAAGKVKKAWLIYLGDELDIMEYRS